MSEDKYGKVPTGNGLRRSRQARSEGRYHAEELRGVKVSDVEQLQRHALRPNHQAELRRGCQERELPCTGCRQVAAQLARSDVPLKPKPLSSLPFSYHPYDQHLAHCILQKRLTLGLSSGNFGLRFTKPNSLTGTAHMIRANYMYRRGRSYLTFHLVSRLRSTFPMESEWRTFIYESGDVVS